MTPTTETVIFEDLGEKNLILSRFFSSRELIALNTFMTRKRLAPIRKMKVLSNYEGSVFSYQRKRALKVVNANEARDLIQAIESEYVPAYRREPNKNEMILSNIVNSLSKLLKEGKI